MQRELDEVARLDARDGPLRRLDASLDRAEALLELAEPRRQWLEGPNCRAACGGLVLELADRRANRLQIAPREPVGGTVALERLLDAELAPGKERGCDDGDNREQQRGRALPQRTHDAALLAAASVRVAVVVGRAAGWRRQGGVGFGHGLSPRRGVRSR